ncbi:hypothetical protein [Polyangium jinanense]|uniref:Uncharacterized protein n=2 Tax=Polyangium jinanense TaxID=2829994 RepID=A0A9X4AWF3_9BACT|nr:hypothetical protein [Polyangium jinanense]MDC3985280.1 hypothetical protein [Polyangium jinanense]
MEPEIELERFAALCAEVEAGTPLEEVLRVEALSAEAWGVSRNAWMERMSREPEATRNALEARYKAAFEARSRAIEARKARAGAGGGEDEPTPPRAHSVPLGLMDTVPMLPTADPEQLLARLRARRAAAAAAAGEGATPLAPTVTGAPAVKGPPPPPRESAPGAKVPPDEHTPPMRARVATIPDPLPARQTQPMPATPSRPALPFQAAPPAPLPPPPPPKQSSPGMMAAVLPPPAPPPKPIGAAPQQPQQPAGYGYPPAPGSPAAAGPASTGAPVSSSSYSQRPTPVPMPPTVPQPMTLAGFPAVAQGPQLSLERYAAFAAEIAVNPAALAEIRAKYGLTDTAHTAETEAWQRRFAADRETYVRYATLYQHYRDWFAARGPR